MVTRDNTAIRSKSYCENPHQAGADCTYLQQCHVVDVNIFSDIS